MTAATGWRLVPVKLPDDMIEAYYAACHRNGFTAHINASCAWEAMLSAAPQPGVTAEEIAQLIEPEADHWIENAAWTEDRSAWRRRKAEALTKAQAILSLISSNPTQPPTDRKEA